MANPNTSQIKDQIEFDLVFGVPERFRFRCSCGWKGLWWDDLETAMERAQRLADTHTCKD